VRLDVVDDGRGLAEGALAQRSGHHGLRWLAERVHGLGGTFSIEPALPQGVRLGVSVPQRATEAAVEAPATMAGA
jgi:two-component system sensor histidine kinase UhpB